MRRRLVFLALFVVATLGVVGLYQAGLSRLEVDVYRERLDTLGLAYEQLLEAHNEIVKKTTVTDLQVEKGRLFLAVRNAQGLVRRIATPFDPAREIYVDYVVLDGRLWIRRIYDAETPPSRGLVIDASLERIDWDDSRYTLGKAVYRSLAEGRWVVTVTGNGSLGLVRSDEAAPLSPPPPVKDYAEIKAELEADLDRVGPGDVLRKALSFGG